MTAVLGAAKWSGRVAALSVVPPLCTSPAGKVMVCPGKVPRSMQAADRGRLRTVSGPESLPWMRDLGHPAAPATLVDVAAWPEGLDGLHYLTLACPRCPPGPNFAAHSATVRAWLRTRYPSPAPPREGLERSAALVHLQRMAGGSRALTEDSTAALRDAARRHELRYAAATTWSRSCGYARAAAAVRQATVAVGAHGADLTLAMLMLEEGAALIEVVPRLYAYHDGWFVYGAVSGGVHCIRVVLPESAVAYNATGDAAGDAALQAVRQGAARARDSISLRAPLEVRKVRSDITVTAAQWDAALTAAHRLGR
eukprot:TRINITY_DN41423_c0_g1_i1.p1 TRINITY_DN41423_c0_g1~~TRINITY_DN41423_c0_g1_i1.p1  ORF type:complete len:326 (+),score=51.93 TRINITY_DN41423_c0_g1_i1:47-979(+)